MREEMEGVEDREDEQPSATGGCLCGAVRYQLFGPLRDVVNCHCGQCLRTHGNFAAYSKVKRAAFKFVERQGLRWYGSSDRARRGFCRHCGSSLLWERSDGDAISVSAGSIDRPTGLKTTHDIFVSDKGDYYELAPGTDIILHGGLSKEKEGSAAFGAHAGGQALAGMSDRDSGDRE
ncbi:GFA family protein [Pelagibius sp. Alg239-R121]|uniref:GFA family protein n=1 Tax=Pelagibius sp. Alg239-R121 TaxID=2993448 RepID=UPI0024A6EFC8|nr:GFA family protein [Pelagibius sp. Alg239-R121]